MSATSSGATPTLAEYQQLHHKMSKKVAQLTKVIYLLNTRNDENEWEMQRVEEAYEKELDACVKECQQKVERFKKVRQELQRDV